MKRLIFLTALVLVGSVGSAQATTINFEDLALDINGVGGDRVSGGFLFDTALNHSHIDNGTWGTSNGTQFMMVDNVTANPNGINNSTTFSPIGGGPFALISIDLSEAGNAGTTAQQIQITGNLFGGGTIGLLLTLDFNLGFQTVTFGAGWNNLSSVVLTGMAGVCCGPIPGNYYAFDNVVVNAVPEPATLSLLGLGSAYLFGRRRRR
jgi:PEP-CTERM motif-containing protein